MKKFLYLITLVLLVVIMAACGADEEPVSTEVPEENIDTTVDSNTEDTTAEETERTTLKDAIEGDVIEDQHFGTYEITKVIEPEEKQYQSDSVEFDFEYVKFAKFKPENPDMFDGKEELSLAIMFITSENTSDDTVSFHPFSTILTTDTKQQINAAMMLNKGESEHIGQVIQEHYVSYDLGEESHEDISELTFTIDGTAKENRKVGESVTVKIPID